MTTVITGPSIHLETGKVYRAVVRVTYPKLVVSESDVEKKFAGFGFTHVRAWLDTPPSDWPMDQRPPPPSSGGWWAYVEGTWEKPTADVKRDPLIERVWVHANAAGYVAPPSSSRGSSPIPLGLAVWALKELFL